MHRKQEVLIMAVHIGMEKRQALLAELREL